MYTVSAKKWNHYIFGSNLLTDFQSSFTDKLTMK